MSTITKERLTKILIETTALIKECSSRTGDSSGVSTEVNAELFAEVTRIALASLEAEPVAWDYEWASCITCEGPQDFKRVIEREAPPEWAIDEGQARNITPLYTDPPSLSDSMEQESVQWGAPKTVKQLIGQLHTLDPDLETTALLRMPADFRDGNAVRQVPLSISYERMDGQWLAPYKSEHRKVLAFWAKPDDRNTAERGEELYTSPPEPVSVPDAYIRDDRGRMILNGKPEPRIGYGAGWNACRAAMLQGAENDGSLCGIHAAPELNSSPNDGKSPSSISQVIPDRWENCKHLLPIGELIHRLEEQTGDKWISTRDAIPDGYALVPVEPTEDMIVEGFESAPNEDFSDPAVWREYQAMSGCQQAAHRARLCWAAMIASAPSMEMK